MTALARAVAEVAACARPWLAPYAALSQQLAHQARAGQTVAQDLNGLLNPGCEIHLRAAALCFVAHGEMPKGEAYEAFIARTARVPTRDNLHDLFNGLVWLRFPALKRRLNELQAEQIARAGNSPSRGAVRDALTLFDENAALWQAPAVLVEALRRRDWQALFIGHRAAWADARLTLFGHALLEKLTQPRKAITAHVWVVPDSVQADRHLANTLSVEWLTATSHLPLPVLGVPGWWAANQAAGFYADAAVFRPLRPPGAAAAAGTVGTGL